MSRESKIFYTGSNEKVSKTIKNHESFGWELLSINGLYVSMTRETQNKVYADLVKYENEYESLYLKQSELAKPKIPYAFNFLRLLIGLVLFIFPGIIYVVFKIIEEIIFRKRMKTYEIEFEKYEQKMIEVCNASRVIFFSKQD